MSDSAHTATAVLLPAASVGLFVADAQIREEASTLSTDWRFARVGVSIQNGDVETAIQYAEAQATPDLLIVETDTIDDRFIQRLEVLAANCSGNTSAVVIGPVNDVYLYRKLITMGVSDYLARPIDKAVLLEVIAKTLIEKQGITESRLIAFIGAKGGVGASSLAEATAEAVSTRLDQKTIMMDAAGGWSYMSVGFGTEPTTTFNETVRANQSPDQDALKRMLHIVDDKLTILATGSDPMLEDAVSAENFEAILNRLMLTYPTTIVDLSGATAPIKKLVVNKAHEIVLVTTPTLPSLRAARTLLNEMKDLKGGSGQQIELVVNMVGQAPTLEVSKSDIEAALDRKPSLYIPYDAKTFMGAQLAGKKLIDFKGIDNIIEDLLVLCRKVIRAQDNASASTKKAEKGFFGELLGVLKSK